MAYLDKVSNFGKTTVSNPYNATDTSIVVADASRLPINADAPYNVTWWNSTDFADPADDPNRELVRVTAVSGNTLTVSRAQEGTTGSTKNAAGKTYKMALCLTKKFRDDVDLKLDGLAKSIVKAKRSADQTIATGAAFTKVQFNSEDIDLSSEFDPTTNFEFKPVKAGKYLIHAQLVFAASTVDSAKIYDMELRKNASPGSGESRKATESIITLRATDIMDLITTDVVTVVVRHDQTASQTLSSNSRYTFLLVSSLYTGA